MAFPELGDIPTEVTDSNIVNGETTDTPRTLTTAQRRRRLWKRRIQWFLDETNTPTAGQTLKVLRMMLRHMLGSL